MSLGGGKSEFFTGEFFLSFFSKSLSTVFHGLLGHVSGTTEFASNLSGSTLGRGFQVGIGSINKGATTLVSFSSEEGCFFL